MSITAALLFSIALPLRVFNPLDSAVEGTLMCGAEQRLLHVEGRDVVDIGDCSEPTALEPLRIVESTAACAMDAPMFGCKRGTATVSVPYEVGSSYLWTVEGATILGGLGTNRLLLLLGEGPSARVQVNSCEAVIALRDPIAVDELEASPNATANEPVTIRWTYATGVPVSQVLVSEEFDEPVVVDASARSYTWTPDTGGTKTVELRASYGVTTPVTADQPHRRRAVAPVQGGVASECAGGSKTLQFEVRGCGVKTPRLVAPSSVEVGTTFTASTEVAAGQSVTWRVDGGAIVSGANTETVRIKVDDYATSLRVRVEISAGPDCSARTVRDITLVPRAQCGSAAPTASLAVEGYVCTKARVRATFTGTPPFRGEWSDGTPFETTETSITHEYAKPGVYTIDDFRDGVCRGQVTQTARVDAFGPRATLRTVNGNCTNSKVVATFSGVPPFSGIWNDGTRFATNETTLERTGLPYSEIFIYNLSDQVCGVYDSTIGSNRIPIRPAPRAEAAKPLFCLWDPRMPMQINVWNGKAPFTIYWSDGEVTTSVGSTAGSATRIISTTSWLEEYRITRVTDQSCEAEILTPVVKASYRPAPKIVRDPDAEFILCYGAGGKASIDTRQLHPDADVTWKLTGGTLLSGQGTTNVTFKIDPGTAYLSASATYPDGYCDGREESAAYMYGDEPWFWNMAASQTIFPAGQSTQITFDKNIHAEWWSVLSTDPGREDDLGQPTCKDGHCKYVFRDTHGPGTFTLTFRYGGRCIDTYRDATVTLTVTGQ